MKVTVSRRHVLAGIPAAAMTPAAALAANETHASDSACASDTADPSRRQDLAEDPAIAAVERHREAMRAWERSLTSHDEALGVQRLRAANDAILAWLTTAPTTMAGAIATLEYAATRDGSRRSCLKAPTTTLSGSPPPNSFRR